MLRHRAPRSKAAAWHDCCIGTFAMKADDRADLEIFEDFAFQRRTWLVERVGWILLALLVAAALLGLFGGGILGSARVSTADGSLAISYDRFWRQHSPTELRLEAVPPTAGSPLRIWISRDYIERTHISQIMPTPTITEVSPDRIVLEFAVGGGRGSVSVMLRIEPLAPWRTIGRVGVEGGEDLSFNQYIYP